MVDKIMVVDDDKSITDAVATSLQLEKYDTIQVYSGRECLQKLDDSIDVVFLDIKMPEMDGLEVLRRIKSRQPQIYVIMFTAFATVDSAIQALKDGAFDYIRKPFSIDDVERCILGVLEDIKFKRKSRIASHGRGGDCFNSFKELIRDREGICITRKDPGYVNKKYGLKKASFIRLTDRDVGKTKEPYVHSTELDKLSTLIEDFVACNKKSVVLITDIEYLMHNNPISTVKKFIYAVYRKITCKNSRLILSANLKKIGEKEVTMLEDLVSDIYMYPMIESTLNPLRRSILFLLSTYGTINFTRITHELEIKDPPKLSFHLKKLKSDGAIDQDEERKYFLTETGEEVVSILKNMREFDIKEPKNLLWYHSIPPHLI